MVASISNPYDIFSPLSERNHILHEEMRIKDPVHCAIHPQTGHRYWFLTRYDNCLQFLKDKRFGKEFRKHLPAQLSNQWVADDTADIINRHMLNLDDPAHERLKSLVHFDFTPLRISSLRTHLQTIADSLFDAIEASVVDGDEFDLTERYIKQFPLLSIAEILGIPLEDYQESLLVDTRYARSGSCYSTCCGSSFFCIFAQTN